MGSSSYCGVAGVSIHAFRGEGDRPRVVVLVRGFSFNPRLPGGRRPCGRWRGRRGVRFNPRLPGGRRRRTVHHYRTGGWFQSTPSGGKATSLAAVTERWIGVSIHAFRGEGDSTAGCASTQLVGFNPRLPGGRRRHKGLGTLAQYEVSIHAFRGEGDRQLGRNPPHDQRFNPRLPGGRRPPALTAPAAANRFNPRLPGGRRPTARRCSGTRI